MDASVASSRPVAGAISGQCTGTLIGRRTARLAPASRAASIARSMAREAPATATCPGALKLTAETWPSPASSRTPAHNATTASSSRPMIAAMPPSPSGTASCMNRPRAETARTASTKSSAPNATSAEYSPRLWPAATPGRGPPRAAQHRHAATPAASIAGCVCSVAFRRFCGPSCASFHRS